MPNYEKRQQNRALIMDSLDSMIKLAYSGLPDIEYNALKVIKAFIKTKSIEDRLTNDPKSSGSEDK